MTTAPERDYDSVDAYPYLPELHGAVGERMNPFPRKTFQRALDAALQVPAGEGRRALLQAVSSGVGAHLRGMEERKTNETLTALLAQQNPDAHRFLEAIAAMRSYVKRVRDLFRKCVETERNRGVDLGCTSWFWFDHELAITEQVVEARLRLACSLPAQPAVSNSEEG